MRGAVAAHRRGLGRRDHLDHPEQCLRRRRRGDRGGGGRRAGADGDRSTRCPPAPPCSSSSAGPTPAAASCSTRTTTTAGRHPDSDIFLDDVTVSRRHAEFRRTGAGSRCPTSAASTAPTSTASGSRGSALTGGDEVQIGKFRLVFLTGSQAGGEARVTGGRMTAARVRPGIHEHRRGARAPASGFSRRHDLQDPVPRVRGSGQPDRTPSGYRKFSARTWTAALRARRAARPLPAAAGDQGAARRARPRASSRPTRPGEHRGLPRALVAADGLARRRGLRPSRAPIRLSRSELLAATGLTDEPLDQLEQFGLVQPLAAATTTTTSLTVAQAVGELARYGIEPRHLRAFRTAADREVGLVEQVVTPVRQRGPEARGRAEEAVAGTRRTVGAAARSPGEGRATCGARRLARKPWGIGGVRYYERGLVTVLPRGRRHRTCRFDRGVPASTVREASAA